MIGDEVAFDGEAEATAAEILSEDTGVASVNDVERVALRQMVMAQNVVVDIENMQRVANSALDNDFDAGARSAAITEVMAIMIRLHVVRQ